VSARLRIVSDAREEATQLYGGGQFALPLEDGADRGGNGFSNKGDGQKERWSCTSNRASHPFVTLSRASDARL
jgi:hypothetical protein